MEGIITKGSMIIALLTAATALQGCEPLERLIHAANPSDPVHAFKEANNGPYTAGAAVVTEIIVEEQQGTTEPTYVPPPKDCTKEAYRWRYQIMSECDTILGYYE